MGFRHEDKELARAYVVIQHYHQRFEPMEGLLKGTIFPELYQPYFPWERTDNRRKTYQVTHTSRNSFAAPVRGGNQVGRR